MFCSTCAGSGKVLGNGMILTECKDCEGFGRVSAEKPEKSAKIDKKSKPYKDAIKEIMGLNPAISREDAAKMFEETYEKV